MLVVDDILAFPFTSILWIFKEIHKVAMAETEDEAEAITAELRLLYMKLETGEISEDAFDARERELLDRLDAIQATRKGEEAAAGEPPAPEAQGEPG